MTLLGYVRISTDDGCQTALRQLDELRAAGCTEVVEEHASGAERWEAGNAGNGGGSLHAQIARLRQRLEISREQLATSDAVLTRLDTPIIDGHMSEGRSMKRRGEEEDKTPGGSARRREIAAQQQARAEAARVGAEAQRQLWEIARNTNEDGRVAGEELRQAEEAIRLSHEEIRAAREEIREAKEAVRLLAEEVRQDAERNRSEAEELRVEAEAIRRELQQQREKLEAERRTHWPSNTPLPDAQAAALAAL